MFLMQLHLRALSEIKLFADIISIHSVLYLTKSNNVLYLRLTHIHNEAELINLQHNNTRLL